MAFFSSKPPPRFDGISSDSRTHNGAIAKWLRRQIRTAYDICSSLRAQVQILLASVRRTFESCFSPSDEDIELSGTCVRFVIDVTLSPEVVKIIFVSEI
jgi:hypothetical protein